MKTAIKINAEDEAGAYVHSGKMLYARGDIENAIACFERAIEIKPDSWEANAAIYDLFDRIRVPELEIMGYQRIYEQSPNITDAGPLRIRIETSSVCNLRCQHCPTGTSYNSAERSIMTMDLFEKILAQTKEMKILYNCVLYLGGEPLLNKNFPAMCQKIKNGTKNVSIHFNTNAMLINEEICKDLANCRIERIGISIDGCSPEENNAIRLGSEYRTVVKNVKMLRYYLKEAEIGIDNTILKRYGDPEEPVVPDFIRQDFAGLPISTKYAMKWPGLDINKSSLKQLSIERKKPYNFCNKPFTEITVRSNGDVLMCCYDILGENVMGNINDTKLMNIWKGQEYKQLRQNMLDQETSLLPDACKKCIQYSGEIPIIVTQ